SGIWFLHLWLVSPRHHRLESRMREIRPSGLEGGVARKRHPYPYRRAGILPAAMSEHLLTANLLFAGFSPKISAD
ncbi:MAG TPA: hypothetical protein VFE51_27480, partial [Verrucomicrobiae bacterium]|nr:hypothetical protein [Verrucomicrobiae bacterium]